MRSLKKQAMHGAFWSFIERFGQQGIQFVVSVFLARLLEPKDFGVLGMLMIFFAMAQSIVDSGFGQALIQKQGANHTDASTVFWFNLIAGMLMTGALFASAPFIAGFYDVPLLEPITQVYSLNLFINCFGVVHNALLMKELAFKRRMWAVLVSIIVSAGVGIGMAWHGFGVWSLVWQGLIMNGIRTVGLWGVHPWRPTFVFSISSFRGLWKFGSNMLLSGLLNSFFDNIYLVVIGRVYAPAQLGFYQRGKRLMMLTSQSLSQVVAQVNFPILSKMQDDPERMRRAFCQVLKATMFFIMPMMFGLAAVASNFIFVLLGDKWMACVPYLQVLCIVGVLFPLHLLNLDVVKAVGRSDIFFKLEVIKKLLVVINVAITWRIGILAMLWGQVVCSFLCLGINAFYTSRLLSFGLWMQVRAIFKILLASIAMGFLVFIVDYAFLLDHFHTLLLQGFTGGIVFVCSARLLNAFEGADVIRKILVGSRV